MDRLEEMGSFFDSRADTYEAHMMEAADGAAWYGEKTALALPDLRGKRLLDLGCGSGLELEWIFRRFPDVSVTGIDLSEGLMALLRGKYPDKIRSGQLVLIHGSYFDVPFGTGEFDAVVAVQTIHHFTHQQKLALYRKIYAALRNGGCYVETDYTAPTKEYEEKYLSEHDRLRREQGIEAGFYHYDIPFTLEHQAALLREAGFSRVECCWQRANTSITAAGK